MQFILRVTNQSDSKEIYERQFNQEIITIGRDSSNSLILDDTKRLISRRHAKIKREGKQYCIFDEDSRNGTFLNEQKITPQQPYPLEDGDTLKIGDYLIHYTRVVARTEDEDTTQVFENPFHKEAQGIVAFLQEIQQKYDSLAPNIDSEVLQRAFKEAFEGIEAVETEKVIAGELAARSGKKSIETTSPLMPLSQDAPTMVRVGQALDLFMDAVISLVKGAWKFRTEFVGDTIMQAKDSLHSLTAGELKKLLFETEISEKEFQKLLSRSKNQIDESLLHQLALLDGYRASIKEGVQELIQYIDPVKLEEEFSKKIFPLGPIKIPYRWIPFYVQLNTYYVIRKRFRELLEEDRGAFDRKIFRPSFIRAYMNTMSTARREMSAAEK